MDTKRQGTHPTIGAIFPTAHSIIIKKFTASATEAELDALFMNAKEGHIVRLTPKELDYPQPPILMNCDNAMATDIANVTVKK